MRIAKASQAVFAATLIGLGILGLIKGNLSVVWEPMANGVRAHEVLAYLCALVSAVCGIGLLWKRTAALAARVLLAYLLLWLLVFRVPGLLRSIAVDVYWAACKAAVMVAAAWVLYVWCATDWDRQRIGFATGDKGLRIARAFYGAAIIPFGLAHFQFVQHTADLVPGWLPAHVAWAYFFGATFIAAGIAVLIGVCARLATWLSALQMGMFTVLVWLPVVVKGTMNSFQWSETLVSWALTVAGWVVADSYRSMPSFAGEKRSAASPHTASA